MKRLLSVILAFLLMLGLGSPALAANAKAVTMRVELVEGSVTIKDAGGVTLDYFEGIQLYSGYSVETGDDSCAYISLDEDKAIKLAMNTAVSIKKSGRKLQVKLMAGEIMFNVTTPLAGNETLEIRTSTMITGVRGSSGGVNAETGEIFYGTGHGIVWFRETDQTSSLYGLSQRTELWGGRIVSVNWPVKDMELSDFSALFLGEVAENPDLQNSLKMEGRFDPQDMINLLPIILEAEIAAREEAKSSAVPLPESATDSPVNGDNVNPAFNKNWDLPTIVTPPPIIDLDDFIIPDDPMNPDEPETTAYTVTWQDEDGTILETDKNVPVGTVPEFNGSDPIKAANAQYTYTFAGWDSIPAAVTGDAIYTATYKETPKTYTVTWKVDDETTTVKYDYGSVIVPPADTTKTGYTFTGWGGNVPETMPAENLSFTAQWDVNTYTVTWKQDDGTVIDTTTVAYGEVPTHAAPTKEADAQYTYTFAAWDPTPVAVTGDAEYTAKYSSTVNTYTVIWKDENGDVLETDENVPYGSTPSFDAEEPSKEATAQYSYPFTGWSPEIAAVTGDAEYTAIYTETVNKFTVTWKDENGDVLETDENVAFGSTPSFDAEEPTKEATAQFSYAFAGWSPELAIVTDDAEYTANFDVSCFVSVEIPEGVASIQLGSTTVTSSTDACKVPYNEALDVSYTLKDGYLAGEATKLLIGDTASGETYTFQGGEAVTVADFYKIVTALNDTQVTMNSAINSDVNLDNDFEMNYDLIITEGSSLTIGESGTLTLAEGNTIINNGTITVEGTLTNYGTVTNEDAIIVSSGGIFNNYSADTLNNNGKLYVFGILYNGDFYDDTVVGRIINGNNALIVNLGEFYSETSPFENSGLFINGGECNISEYSSGGFCGTSDMDSLSNQTIDVISETPYWYFTDGTVDDTYDLHIEGTGAMGNYNTSNTAPWYFYWNEIVSVSIEDGVTSIGSDAFNNCRSIAAIELPSSLTIIKDSSFQDCYALKSVVIPADVTKIETKAFAGCISMEAIVFLGSVEEIGENAFLQCNNLREARFFGDVPTVTGDVFGDSAYIGEGFRVTYAPGTNGWDNATAPWSNYVLRELDPSVSPSDPAGWYTVFFEMNGHGTEIDMQYITPNSCAVEPPEPVDPDNEYTCVGWFSDPGTTTPFSFTTPITEDIILYAKWRAILEGSGP